ncbi:methyltransferase-like protein 27 [Labrus mixtus]|uniref:methyltransferase-like protein 27 n=1 Tax=Labrus mixtus TaxID=508554 RepID=UPI0029BFEA95|nr:methyltransferase-like protein 27 [Labrus mixtus]
MSDCCRSVDDVRAFLHSSKNLDPQERMKFYDSWAPTYERDSETISYRAPNIVVDFLNRNLPGSHEDVKVLDVACGSGLVGKLMSELGFRNFVGVDGSKGMLDLAAQSGLYQDLKLALLGTDQLPAQTGAFDLVVIIGALRAGFVPVSVIRELWQAAKPGGYVCMSRVDPKSESGEKYKLSMKRELQQMEEEGLWSPVSTGDMKKYMMDVYHNQKEDEQYLDGTMYLYRKSIS